MQTPRSQALRRLTYYLIGLALGCMILGVYFQGRRAYVAERARRDQAEQMAAEAAMAAERAARANPPANPPPGPSK